MKQQSTKQAPTINQPSAYPLRIKHISIEQTEDRTTKTGCKNYPSISENWHKEVSSFLEMISQENAHRKRLP
jgi:hypothetical protein